MEEFFKPLPKPYCVLWIDRKKIMDVVRYQFDFNLCEQGDGMDDAELLRKLNSVGKASFVEDFEIHKRFAAGLISREEGKAQIMEAHGHTEAGANMRLGSAWLIFKAGREQDALRLVVEAKRVKASAVVAAKALLGINKG